MHIAPFSLKRAHQSTLRYLRRFAKHYDLTPARYDLLNLVGDGLMPQCEIHKGLGVTRATTSRMLIALEKLGLIQRGRPYINRRRQNRRNFLVSLTREGMRRVRAVRDSIVAPWFQLAFEHYYVAHGWTREAAFFEVDQLICSVDGIAKHFGDTAENIYPCEEPDGGPYPRLPVTCLWSNPSPDRHDLLYFDPQEAA